MSIFLAGLFAVPQTVVTNKETINVSCSLPEKKTIPSLQVNHFCSYNKSDPRPAPGPITRPKFMIPSSLRGHCPNTDYASPLLQYRREGSSSDQETMIALGG